jgi:ribosome biogenesis GTPase
MSIKQDKDKQPATHANPNLARLGWSSYFEAQLEDSDVAPARVVGVKKNYFNVSDGEKEFLATAAGRLMHQPGGLYPVTGDWVLLSGTLITAVLPRKNALSRGAAGARHKRDAQPKKEQMLAANLDTVFIVCGLDRDFNLRRIERYLNLIYNCGLNPAIVLTKADLHQYPEELAGQVEVIAFGVPIHLVSALDGQGLAPLEAYLAPGRTCTMVGSSGAGKSTLVNRLYGASVQATRSISDSVGKGRHTTTSRDLIMMPQGGMVIDNPGIREIAFWSDDQGAGAAFPEIEALARECRFADCSHTSEPGCRVLRAVAEGEISPARLESYRKMKRELDYLASREHKSADRVEKERWKDVALKIKSITKSRKHRG